jgi:tRNA G37 N-methylase Trm5
MIEKNDRQIYNIDINRVSPLRYIGIRNILADVRILCSELDRLLYTWLKLSAESIDNGQLVNQENNITYYIMCKSNHMLKIIILW